NTPTTILPAINSVLFEAKARKCLTFDEIAKALWKGEVWVAAAFYGQAKFTPEELQKVYSSEVLDINVGLLRAGLGDHWWPQKGLGPIPPTDPVIYRLYKGVLVYGYVIKAIIHEKYCIFLASLPLTIVSKINVEKKANPKDDRVLLTFE
ncbi:hypothetical protein DFH07DRAFT_740427, partial [Mycena maculata]